MKSGPDRMESSPDELESSPDKMENGPSSTHNFPTEAREREKQRRKAQEASGHKHVPKKKPQTVEHHHDDLGDDLSGLGPNIEALYADLDPTQEADAISSDSAQSSDDDHITGFQHFGLTNASGLAEPPSSVMIAASLDEVAQILAYAGPGVDVAELCGGEARATTVAIRRRLVGGRNFDLVTQVDLGCPQQQRTCLNYLTQHSVLVLIMAPRCRTLGPTSSLNRAINYDTWKRHYNEDMPHARFCARAAWHQLQQGRFPD